MGQIQKKLRLFMRASIALVAAALLLDFVLPGQRFTTDVIKVDRKIQKHNNAAKGHHYSYQLSSTQHTFSVSETVAKCTKPGDDIEYSISRLFGEVNWCKPMQMQTRAYYSLRWLAALLLPLSVLVLMFVAPRVKSALDVDVLVFVLQVVLMVEVVFFVLA
jgi:hypothetical protein